MFEIRNYHYEPTKFDLYKTWAIKEAVPHIKAKFDLVGFWMDNGNKPELKGSDPVPHKHGPANITWIIRWDSMDARNDGHATVFGSEEWKVIWANHPDASGYLQMEVKFAEEV
ncbi:MAG: hypothetical protein ACJAVI_001654 [Candidatus Azotimanducaceae bacterium]|jgi:hypothetical protein